MNELAASLTEAGRLAAESGQEDSRRSRGNGVGKIVSGRVSRQGTSATSIDMEATDKNSASSMLPCFYSYFQDEGIIEGKADVSLSLFLHDSSQVTTINPVEGSGDSGLEAWKGEEYEPDRALHIATTYLKFKKYLDLNPEQCLRYCFGGQVQLTTKAPDGRLWKY